MKIINRQLMLILGVLLSLLMFTQEANAAHFKGGNITWKVITGNTAEFTVTTVWQSRHTVPTLVSPTVTSIVLLSENIVSTTSNGVITVVQKYSGIVPNDNNSHRVSIGSCCRISTLSNPNGSDSNYEVFAEINLSSGNSYSPKSTVASVVKVPVNNSAASFIIPANDLDGDELTFRLATLAEMGFVQPSGLTVSNSGVLTVNTTLPGYTIGQLYTVGVIISDGFTDSFIDFQLEITGISLPPVFNYNITPVNGQEFTINAGDSLQFDVEISDPDGSIASLFLSGNPAGSHFNSIPLESTDTAKSTFSWKPTALDAGNYIINFIGEDNIGTQTTTTISIIVSANVVEDCTSSTKRNGYKHGFEWIQSVELGHDIHNISGKTEKSYMEYTQQELHVDTSEVVSVVLTPGYTSREYTEYWSIWVDWNNDGDFGDHGESVFKRKGKGVVNGQFTIPDHVSGEVKIKVAMGWGSYPPYCGDFISGEIEIYTLRVNQNSPSGGGHSH